MIAIRLVRSKLRKREDHSNSVHPEPTVVQTATSPVSTIAPPSYPDEGCCTQMSTTTTSTDLGNHTAGEQDNVYATANPADQFVWQFPPPYPPPHTPQFTLYNDQVGTPFPFSSFPVPCDREGNENQSTYLLSVFLDQLRRPVEPVFPDFAALSPAPRQDNSRTLTAIDIPIERSLECDSGATNWHGC